MIWTAQVPPHACPSLVQLLRRREEASIFPTAIVFWTGPSILAYLSPIVTGYWPSLWKRKRKPKGTHRGRGQLSCPGPGTPKPLLLMALDKSCWPSQATARIIWLLINQCSPKQEETELNLEAVLPRINDEDKRSWFLYPSLSSHYLPLSLIALVPPNALGRTLAWRGHLSWCQPSMLVLHNNSWKGLLKQILPEVPRAATVPAAQEQSQSVPASVSDSIFQSPGPVAAGLQLSPRVRQMTCAGAQGSDTKGPKFPRTILDFFSQNCI